MKIIQSPSPNFSTSKYTKIGVQIHKTLGLMPWTLKHLQKHTTWVSAHYLITKTGDIHQLVQLKDRPWSSGIISRPSERAKKIMMKTAWGTYVKPGHYLIQIEYECLHHETYTEKQYEASVWLFNQFPFDVTDDNFLEHQDTAIHKPELEKERAETLKRLNVPNECDSKRLVLENWGQLRLKTEDGKIILYKNV